MAPGAGAATVPSMLIGVFGLNSYASAAPETGLELARLAEDLGYDSLWAGEHVVLPSPRVAPAPMEPTDPILDPLVWLAFVAAATTRVRLGTGIIILPQRQPLVLAKQVASLDVLSGGRLVLGVGAGYLEPELRRHRRAHVGAGQPDRRAPRRDARAVDRAGPGQLPRPLHRRRRDRRPPAARAGRRPADRRGRPVSGRAPPGRRPRPRLVRLPPDGRGGGRAGGGPGARRGDHAPAAPPRPAGDQRHAGRARRRRPGAGLRRRRRRPVDPPAGRPAARQRWPPTCAATPSCSTSRPDGSVTARRRPRPPRRRAPSGSPPCRPGCARSRRRTPRPSAPCTRPGARGPRR